MENGTIKEYEKYAMSRKNTYEWQSAKKLERVADIFEPGAETNVMWEFKIRTDKWKKHLWN